MRTAVLGSVEAFCTEGILFVPVVCGLQRIGQSPSSDSTQEKLVALRGDKPLSFAPLFVHHFLMNWHKLFSRDTTQFCGLNLQTH